ncbi:MAG: proteasome subunit alpha [Actinomycetota bacterium]|jgi:proteasome alpha subunit|nr:proteasome subunit alpha [Actinomycetota bacterium]
MSMPFYVSPEQLMKDRADFARKGISRGRSVVVVQCADGLLFVAENPSQALHKISELYDRLAFAAAGRYNEYENLRIAGVRLADMRGYSYDRRDVTGRGLANAYAQTLGAIFSSGGEKPYEVELFVAEVGDTAAEDQIYRVTYEGSVAYEQGFAVMGGSAEQVDNHLKAHYAKGLDLEAALQLAVGALGHDGTTVRTLTGDRLEVAVLDRTRTRPRKFRRLSLAALVSLFGSSNGPDGQSTDTDEQSAETPTESTDTEGEAAAGVPEDSDAEDAASTEGATEPEAAVETPSEPPA